MGCSPLLPATDRAVPPLPLLLPPPRPRRPSPENRLCPCLDPPIPSFHHRLHAWAELTIRMALVMWAGACVAVALGVYRGGKGGDGDGAVIDGGGLDGATARLKVDLFACAIGIVAGAGLVGAVQFVGRPFALPWMAGDEGGQLGGFGELMSGGGGSFGVEKMVTPAGSGINTPIRSSGSSADAVEHHSLLKLKTFLAILAVFAGLSAAMPTAAESVAEPKLQKRVRAYDCEYYNSPTIGTIAERKCGSFFGVSIDSPQLYDWQWRIDPNRTIVLPRWK
ncbi:hypothetical protein VTK26DRAFT_6212 [Humicola hyalothermophila]